MNDPWRETTLGQCFTPVKRKIDPTSLDRTVPYVGLEHVEPNDWSIRNPGAAGSVTSLVSCFEIEDVLFGRLRPYLCKVAKAEFAGVCSPEILVLRANNSVTPGFLHLLASSDLAIGHAVALSAGSRMPRTSVEDLASLPVVLPTLPEQRRIVHLVGAIDDSIQAASTERSASTQALTALRRNLLAPKPDWRRATLGAVADLKIGRTPSRTEPAFWADSTKHPFLTIADLARWQVGHAREGVTEAAIAQGKAKAVPPDQLLMSFKLSIGRVGITDRWVYPNEAIVWIKPAVQCRRDYLAHWLAAQDLTSGTVRAVKGATLNSRSLAAIEVALPTLERQHEIEGLLEAQRLHAEACAVALSSLADLRARLIVSLLSGDIEIPESYDSPLEAV